MLKVSYVRMHVSCQRIQSIVHVVVENMPQESMHIIAIVYYSCDITTSLYVWYKQITIKK